jgi:hypothetical protein
VRPNGRPCWACGASCCALDVALDAAQIRIARLEQTLARCQSAAERRAPDPTLPTVQELRLELGEARTRIAELERVNGELGRANGRLRHVADTERLRAEHAEDRVRSAFTLAAWGGGRRA